MPQRTLRKSDRMEQELKDLLHWEDDPNITDVTAEIRAAVHERWLRRRRETQTGTVIPPITERGE